MSDDNEDDAAFNQGFEESSKAKPVAAQQQPVAEKQQSAAEPEKPASAAQAAEEPGPEEQAPAKGESQPQPAAKEPKPAKPLPATGKLSADEIDRLRALAAKAPEQDRQLSKAFGTIGELQQQLKTLRANGDARHEQPKPPPRLTGEALVVKRLQEQAMVDLEEDFPDWRDLVGAPQGDEPPDPNHPFRKWLATQTSEYQTKINTSNSARQIARAIEKFKAETAKTPPKVPQSTNKAKVADGDKAAAARRDRIANAVPPKTTAGKTPIKARTADDDFNEGFAQG